MTEEQSIHAALDVKFPALQGKVRIPRPRRLFVPVPAEQIREVFDYAVRELNFSILCTITGLDQGATLGAIYHLARESGVMLNLETSVPKDHPVLATVTDCFPAAEMYEREMIDLLGMQVQGLLPGKRYPLPDNWPPNQFPLRKDWTPEGSAPAAPEESEATDGR